MGHGGRPDNSAFRLAPTVKDRAFERNRASGGRLENVFGSLLVRRFSVRQPEMFRIVEQVSTKKLTSIDQAALCELAQTAMDIDFADMDGDFLQAGCGLGGATIVIAHAKRRTRSLTVHDPFSAGLDAETLTRKTLVSHEADERLNVRLLPGPYEHTISTDGTLALALIDSRKYDSVKILLERLTPRLGKGGHLVVVGYPNRKECKQAVDEFFRGKSGLRLDRKSSLHVIKN
jgi:asparagine synthase (glutamine-hydrolysing)